MNYLKKINRGLILSVIVILTVVFYLVSLSASQKSQKSKIQEVCDKYIQAEVKYRMLPVEYRKYEEMPEEKKNEYIKEMEENIKPYLPEGSQAVELITRRLKNGIENQAEGKDIIHNFEKELIEYEEFVFDKNSVTVTVSTDTSYEGPASDFTSASPRTRTQDTVILQKIKGEWKVVYSDISTPVNAKPDMEMIKAW